MSTMGMIKVISCVSPPEEEKKKFSLCHIQEASCPSPPHQREM
jgi:hypothetical protein